MKNKKYYILLIIFITKITSKNTNENINYDERTKNNLNEAIFAATQALGFRLHRNQINFLTNQEYKKTLTHSRFIDKYNLSKLKEKLTILHDETNYPTNESKLVTGNLPDHKGTIIWFKDPKTIKNHEHLYSKYPNATISKLHPHIVFADAFVELEQDGFNPHKTFSGDFIQPEGMYTKYTGDQFSQFT